MDKAVLESQALKVVIRLEVLAGLLNRMESEKRSNQLQRLAERIERTMNWLVRSFRKLKQQATDIVYAKLRRLFQSQVALHLELKTRCRAL